MRFELNSEGFLLQAQGSVSVQGFNRPLSFNLNELLNWNSSSNNSPTYLTATTQKRCSELCLSQLSHTINRDIHFETNSSEKLDNFIIAFQVITPLMIFALWVFLIIDYEPPTYNNGAYHYPQWAIVIGWIICSLSIICIPAYMIIVIIQSPGKTLMEVCNNGVTLGEF